MSMFTLGRYLRLFAVQVRTSTAAAMQYRLEFITQGITTLLWSAVTLFPLFVVFRTRTAVAGWSEAEALVVVGWFALLKGVLEGAINPSLLAVVEAVRSGTLDFVLLKPADAQFLVSTARIAPWRVVDLVAASLILAFAFTKLGGPPSAPGLVAAVLLLGVALLVLYSIWILVVSISFRVVKVDNLAFFFGSLFDVARWPVSVFRGTAFHFIFTFVFPVALMTTYPAEALLGRLAVSTAFGAVLGSVVFAAVARLTWKRALAYYTSASS